MASYIVLYVLLEYFVSTDCNVKWSPVKQKRVSNRINWTPGDLKMKGNY